MVRKAGQGARREPGTSRHLVGSGGHWSRGQEGWEQVGAVPSVWGADYRAEGWRPAGGGGGGVVEEMRKEMEKMGKFKNYLGWRSHWRECWGMEGEKRLG